MLNKLAALMGLGLLSALPERNKGHKAKSIYIKKPQPLAGAKMRRKAQEKKLTKRWT